jgi:hypothetical protein
MTYSEFIQVLDIPQITLDLHKCFVLTNMEIPDEELAAYLSDKIENMQICLHRAVQGKTYVAVNKSAILGDNLDEYIMVEGLPPTIIHTVESEEDAI